MAQGLSLKDQLFNADSIGDLAAEYAAALPGFDGPGFRDAVLAGMGPLGLLQRLDWIADCLEPRLAAEFPAMAAQLEAAMPPVLDEGRTDDDYGRFIHAVPGILAVRHGLEEHRERALDLLYEATKRFSMEFYIRPFLNRWPEETLARLRLWMRDDNYHVRRLVSEGTRARLPWAKNVEIDPLVPLEFLDVLYADRARYVTRSVANHLNDITKFAPEVVVARLAGWAETGRQDPAEMAWITRHALRTAVKQGHPGALGLMGYRADLRVTAEIALRDVRPRIGGALEMTVTLQTSEPAPVLVDYVLTFHRPGQKAGRKVFKLKQARTRAGAPLVLQKAHRLKGDATTFRLHPGPHRVEVQVNGRVVAGADFDLRA